MLVRSDGPTCSVRFEISGSFAFTYEFQFFLALAVGVIALKLKELAGTPPKGISSDASFKELTGPMIVH